MAFPFDDTTAEETVPVNETPLAGVLDKFTGQKDPQISVDNFNPPSAGDPNYADAIPAQAFSTYFPGMQNDINKGYYSGSIIGNNPIYAASALMPYGLIDARKNALKNAADKKVAQQEAFANKIANLRSPETEHKAVQPEVTQMFYKGLQEDIDQAQQKYGGDWAKKLWGDTNFHKKLQTVKDVAGYEDVAVKHVAELEKASETGEFAITPYIQDAIDNFKTGKFSLMSMSSDPEMQAKAREIFKVQPMLDAVKTSARVAKAIEPDVYEGVADVSPQGLYDILTTTKTTKPSDKRVKDAVELSYKQMYGDRPGAVPYNEYAKMVAANIGKKTETQTQTASTKEGDGSTDPFDESAIQQEQSSMLVGREGKDGAGNITHMQKTIPARYGYTMKRPVTVKLAGSEEMYDLGDSQGGIIRKAPAGMKDAVVQNFTNVPTVRMPGSDKYVPVDEEGQALAKKNGYPMKWELYGVASFQGDEANEFKQKTVLVPAEQVKNSVQKIKGKDKTGVDFDKMAEYTKKLNTVTHKIKGKDYSNDAVEKAAKASGRSIEEYVTEVNK